MSEEDYLKCSCKVCGNHIEFPPSAAGTVAVCPHCSEWTELIAEDENEKEPVRSKAPLLAALAGIVVLAAAVGGFVLWRSRAKSVVDAPAPTLTKIAAVLTNTPPTNAAPIKPPPPVKREKSPDDLKYGGVELEKAKVGSLVYAVGTVTNDSQYQRFGVKVELDLFNKNGKKISSTSDYKDIIEPNAVWQFHALIPDSRTASVKISSLKED